MFPENISFYVKICIAISVLEVKIFLAKDLTNLMTLPAETSKALDTLCLSQHFNSEKASINSYLNKLET